MKTIHDVENLVREYIDRHNMRYQQITRLDDVVKAETFCYTTMEARLSKNGRVLFKVDGKGTSIYK